MTIPNDERLRAIVLEIKKMGGLQALADAADVAARTLYRQIEDAPPAMADDTRGKLVGTLEDVGLLGDYDSKQLRSAVGELRRRATFSRSDHGGAEAGKMMREVEKAPPGGPRPQTKASSHQDDQQQ